MQKRFSCFGLMPKLMLARPPARYDPNPEHPSFHAPEDVSHPIAASDDGPDRP